MKTKPLSIVLICMAFLMSCSNIDDNNEQQENEAEIPVNQKPNILLIIADDMGLDASPGYTVGDVKPNMPNLQVMINNGIRFNNLWSYSVCTPTRASILTGKYGFRTNVMKVDDVLSTSEVSLQKHLDTEISGYNHAVIGKWHLSRDASHPTDMGLNYYAGNLNGGVQSYWNWNLTENGQTSNSTDYTTTKFTDLAIDWIDDQTQPWFLWLAYNAPHTPFHLPPNNLHSQGTLPTDDISIARNPLPYYMAMLEAMDSEIGRLLSSMTPEEKDNTVIIFIGDNGTPNQVAQEYGSNHAKGTLYQGGINVPMIISGKGVNRINQTEDALVNTTDLFATIADIAETGTTEINDSKSFKTLFETSNENFRDYIYTEIGDDSGISDSAIRNTTHKYILFEDGTESLFNLYEDPFENINLLIQPLSVSDMNIYNELKSKLNSIIL